MKPTLIIAAALALAALPAAAQTVWRCGNSYSQQPCAGGTAVATPAPPTAAEAARAERTALSDAKRAEAMEKARLAQERNAPKAIVIGPQAAEPKPAPKVEKKPAKKPEHFTAVAPGSKPKKKSKKS